ncbi:MAG: hypothetical protein MUP17_00305 [candidate division Zixibacteria bacterium]|nr:hypothetical protein [candidate division Zixibacteria bacterium]
MRPTKIYSSLLFVLVALLLTSCSNPKKDYEPIKLLQITTEQSIQGTSDDSAKLKACEDVIKALQEFVKRHPKGEWNITANSALESWQSKKASIQENINRKLDFEAVQKLQDAAEQIMQHSTDYAVRMKSCDDIINSLQTYISKHPEGEWTTSAKTALMSWESRKATLEQELSSLSNKLYGLLKERAIQEANKVHRMSNIEEVRLDSRDKKAVGANIQVTDVYAIRMRGAIIRSSIFKLKVTVSGGIVPETKRVFVDESATVEE